MTNRTPKPSKPLAKAYIVFGADECARPRAARFWARHVEPLAKAAAAMNVRLVQVSNPRLAALLPAIPPGRLHASGREFLPHVSGDTYAELAAAVLIQQPSDHPAATDEALPCTWHEVVPGGRVREKLRDGVKEALEILGTGLLAHPDSTTFRKKLTATRIDDLGYYRQLLRLIYRLLFLMVAEERRLLFKPSREEAARQEVYTRWYSIARLRRGGGNDCRRRNRRREYAAGWSDAAGTLPYGLVV